MGEYIFDATLGGKERFLTENSTIAKWQCPEKVNTSKGEGGTFFEASVSQPFWGIQTPDFVRNFG